MVVFLLIFAPWVVDRIEPPFAVLADPCGHTMDRSLSTLPQGVAEGDALTLTGEIVAKTAEQRRARLTDELNHLLESESDVRHGLPMGRREQDHYSRQAQREGFRARSIYKLEEIDRKVRLFQKGQSVLDLGCAPGSWAQYVTRRVGKRGKVVGVDLQRVDAIQGVTLMQEDVFAIDPKELIAAASGVFDVVLSDMAPATTGNRFTDHVRSVELCHRALGVAVLVSKPGARFVCKVFEGEDVAGLVASVRARYGKVKRVKPRSTRSESVELFIVGLDFRPEPESAEESE